MKDTIAKTTFIVSAVVASVVLIIIIGVGAGVGARNARNKGVIGGGDYDFGGGFDGGSDSGFGGGGGGGGGSFDWGSNEQCEGCYCFYDNPDLFSGCLTSDIDASF